jgi:hypothetical protein
MHDQQQTIRITPEGVDGSGLLKERVELSQMNG